MAEEFRVTVFGKPRGEWRPTFERAKRDAIKLELASWDESKREWYLAVPVAIERRGEPDRRLSRWPTVRPRLRARWTDEDIALLWRILGARAPIEVAAHHLGRSTRAVARKAAAIGIKLAGRPPT